MLAVALEGRAGCWTASSRVLQFMDLGLPLDEKWDEYLPPGVHFVKVTVNADNAQPVMKRIKIISPKLGEALVMEEVA